MRAQLTCVAIVCVAGSTLLSDASAQATRYDRVSFSVDAEENVTNDILVAVLYYERDGARQADVAEHVNRTMSAALQTAERHPAVVVHTLQYRTNPVFRNTSLTGWRARQSLRLEAHGPTALAEVLAALQDLHLLVESVGYAVSKETRDDTEERLIALALARFTARAQLITKSLGRREYRIVRVALTDVKQGPRYERRATSGGATTIRKRTVAEPELTPGFQMMRLRVDGEIEVLK